MQCNKEKTNVMLFLITNMGRIHEKAIDMRGGADIFLVIWDDFTIFV